MNKKNKIYLSFILAFGISAIIFVILGGIVLDGFVDENGKQLFPTLSKVFGFIGIGMLVILLIYAIVQRAYINNQQKLIGKAMTDYIKENKYDELIAYLNMQINKRFIASIVIVCKLNLVVAYMLKEDNSAARELLFNTKWGAFSPHTYYYKLVFYLADNDIDSAKNEYHKLVNTKRKIKAQLQQANKLIDMVETNIYNEEVENNTKLPIVKQICNRYKK